MNKQPELFEKYPSQVILITNLATLINYSAGFYILLQTGRLWTIFFLLYILYLELSLYKSGCASCYYYGKTCAFGRGKIAALLFKKADPQEFCQREFGWKTMLPQIILSLTPIVAGILLLTKEFDWIILILMIIPVILWMVGNPIIYGKLACIHCKQGKICCPASKFFEPKDTQK